MDGEPIQHVAVQKESNMFRHIDIQAKSVASEKHPTRNEDTFFQIPEKNVFGVFDGIGGHSAGDKASQLARESVAQYYQRLHNNLTIQEVQEAMKKVLLNANDVVYNQGQVDHNNMGTTASIVHILEGLNGKRKAVVGNVGDSRVYVLRDGEIIQVTLDDNGVSSVFHDNQRARQLQEKLNNVVKPEKELPEDERFFFEIRNQLSQALGKEYIQPRVYVFDMMPKDRIIACTDGISDNLTDNEINSICVANPNNSQAVSMLIRAAQARSEDKNHCRAKPDDMSVIIAGEHSGAVPQISKAEPVKPAIKVNGNEGLQIGSNVSVKRSSGKIEPGWTIDSFDPITGYVTVIKKGKDSDLVKHIPRTELGSLNR